MNFVLTDGRLLLASRWNRSLLGIARDERGKCEVCVECHCHDCVDTPRVEHPAPHRSVVVASEPITGEVWDPLPEGHLLAVDDAVRAELLTI